MSFLSACFLPDVPNWKAFKLGDHFQLWLPLKSDVKKHGYIFVFCCRCRTRVYSPHQANNQSYLSDVSRLHQVKDIVFHTGGLFLFSLQEAPAERERYVFDHWRVSMQQQMNPYGSSWTHKCLFIKDDLGSLNVVHPGHFSQYCICFCDSALREQPSRRFWDEPVHLTEKHAVSGSRGCYTDQRALWENMKSALFCRLFIPTLYQHLKIGHNKKANRLTLSKHERA